MVEVENDILSKNGSAKFISHDVTNEESWRNVISETLEVFNTFGANGDSVASFINEGEGDATLFFLPGQVTLLSSASYWDFSLQGSPAQVTISALVIDYYGNPVVDAPVAFGGTGVSSWLELQYETDGWTDEGIDGVGAGDGKEGDLVLLEDVAGRIEGNTICAFGDASAWPVQSFLNHYHHEFEYMIKNNGKTMAACLGRK